ncbi:MAG: HAD family hydrolase [Opitutaceae bacterium]|nr:HAD family hydrolase [Opitutaceae bacterium]
MKIIAFDCDSTLSAIEGIDELGRSRGPAVFAQIEAMTHDAMNGRLPVEAVFGRRLEIIQPRRADADAVGRRYVETVEPTAQATIAALKLRGWTPVIISGGFRPLMASLAEHLGIERVEAVDIFFHPDGAYNGYDKNYPTTRSGGKPEIVAALKREFSPTQFVMVGDGASDLETKPSVDRFVGFGRYTPREAVRQGAHDFIYTLDALLKIL